MPVSRHKCPADGKPSSKLIIQNLMRNLKKWFGYFAGFGVPGLTFATTRLGRLKIN
jgi:hypothetical protein